MKQKFRSIFALVLSLIFSMALLTACGGNGDSGGKQSDSGDNGGAETLTMEIAGDAWEADGTVYHFFEDGVVAVDTGYILSYTWDGSYGEISDGGITAAMIYDEDGFFIEGEDELFYPLTYVGDADPSLLDGGDDDSDDEFTDTIDLVGTAWEMVDEEFQFHFFTGGTVASDDGGTASYTWDGNYGEITDGSNSLEMVYDEDGFFVEGNDGIYHEFTYIGEADVSLLAEDDDDDEDEEQDPLGTYDNDNEEMSIVFYNDGTCTVTTLYDAVEGYYSVDANDNLYIELDNGESAEGWYDSSDDTFSLEGLSGWFHYTGSAGYAP